MTLRLAMGPFNCDTDLLFSSTIPAIAVGLSRSVSKASLFQSFHRSSSRLTSRQWLFHFQTLQIRPGSSVQLSRRPRICFPSSKIFAIHQTRFSSSRSSNDGNPEKKASSTAEPFREGDNAESYTPDDAGSKERARKGKILDETPVQTEVDIDTDQSKGLRGIAFILFCCPLSCVLIYLMTHVCTIQWVENNIESNPGFFSQQGLEELEAQRRNALDELRATVDRYPPLAVIMGNWLSKRTHTVSGLEEVS